MVFFLVDDLGHGDLGCYGDGFHRTPVLDRLAAEGVRFTDAYAAAPVCSPSRAALLTGEAPARVRITDWIPGMRYPKARLRVPECERALGLEHTTLAELLSERGYATWHVGKWHLGDAGHWPEDQGFDVNHGGHGKGHPASYHHPYGADPGGVRGSSHAVLNLPAGGESGDYLTDRLTDLALAELDAHVAHSPERPFFLHLAYYNVHTPVEGRADLVEAYRARAASGAEAGSSHAAGGALAGELPWSARSAEYAAMVGAVDENVGRVLARLDHHGLRERTLVVFTSDNGGYLGLSRLGGLREGKGFLYEGGLRVPLLVRWPGVAPAGASSSLPVVGMDLFATVAEAAGLEAERVASEALDGVSLVAHLANPAAASPLETRPLFWHYPHYHTQGRYPGGAARVGRYKLIEWYEDGRLELFDLVADPFERRDLAAREPERARALRTRMADWRAEVGAQLATLNPDADPAAPFAGGYVPGR